MGHFAPDCNTLSQEERSRYERERQRNKEKREERFRKQVIFEEEFSILNSPSGLTMEQAMKYIPAYKKAVKKLSKKKEEKEKNIIRKFGKQKSSVKRCNATIEGIPVEAIIDTGAEITAIQED